MLLLDLEASGIRLIGGGAPLWQSYGSAAADVNRAAIRYARRSTRRFLVVPLRNSQNDASLRLSD
jgi:hypothetical protein